MIAALTFFTIYLFGIYAFFRHAIDTAIDVDDEGNPIDDLSRRRQTRRARV